MGEKERLKREKRTGRPKAVCGLCGRSKRVTSTECCGKSICDDEGTYELLSYARSSCSCNHRRLTLCGTHHTGGHAGDWKNCPKCREDCKTEMYVYYGTNAYNFEKLPSPVSFTPCKCSECGEVVRLG
jgi:hypothetical protein